MNSGENGSFVADVFEENDKHECAIENGCKQNHVTDTHVMARFFGSLLESLATDLLLCWTLKKPRLGPSGRNGPRPVSLNTYSAHREVLNFQTNQFDHAQQAE